MAKPTSGRLISVGGTSLVSHQALSGIEEELPKGEQGSTPSEPTLVLDDRKLPEDSDVFKALRKTLLPTHESVQDRCLQQTRQLARRVDHVEKMLHHHARETWQLRNFVRSYVARSSEQDANNASEPLHGLGDGCMQKELVDGWAQVRKDLLVTAESLKTNWQPEVEVLFCQNAADIRAEMSLHLADHYTQASQDYVEKMNRITDASFLKVSALVSHTMKEMADPAKNASIIGPRSGSTTECDALDVRLPSKPEAPSDALDVRLPSRPEASPVRIKLHQLVECGPPCSGDDVDDGHAISDDVGEEGFQDLAWKVEMSHASI